MRFIYRGREFEVERIHGEWSYRPVGARCWTLVGPTLNFIRVPAAFRQALHRALSLTLEKEKCT